MPPTGSRRNTGGAGPADPETVRVTVTLPAFTCFEVDGLVNIYGPSRAQVIAQIIESWLHDNEAKIAHRKARYEEYRSGRASRPLNPRSE
jgi:hypothetical protein